MIENIPNNYNQLLKLMSNVGYGKNIIKNLHEYNINIWFGTPFQYLVISGSVLNGVIDRK